MGVDIPDIALTTLANFIRLNVPTLTVLEQWPYANEKLTYPSLTITMGKPKRMPEIPYEISCTAPDRHKKVVSNLVVASWDFNFQLDLWCRDKAERKDYTEKVLTLFNSQQVDLSGLDKPDGLSLNMAAHFNESCRYEIDTIEPIDDEAGAQRQERREKISVLVNCREVRQRTYYAMVTIQSNVEVSTEIN